MKFFNQLILQNHVKEIFFLSFLMLVIPSAFAEEPSQGWERLSDMPEAKSEVESIVIENKIYSIGGLDNTGHATDSVFIFDIKTESWSVGTPMPIELHHAGAATFEGKVYVVGGYLEEWIPTGTLLIYDLQTDSWEFGSEMPTPRGALTVQFAPKIP